jgi:hypothetical protein
MVSCFLVGHPWRVLEVSVVANTLFELLATLRHGDEQEMDTKLALVTTARHELGAVLRAAQKCHPWHYALSGITTDDLTLAALLRMTPEQSDQLLLVCGLSMKWKPRHNNKSDGDEKQNKIQAKPNRHAWEIFAVEHNLMEEYFYFNRHQVKEHTGDQKVYWLGVGFSSDKGSCLAVHPKSQFQMSKTPSRLSHKEVWQIRSFSRKVLLILDIYSEATAEDAEDEEDAEEFHSATRLQSDEPDSKLVNQADKNDRMLTSNLLEKIADGKLDVMQLFVLFGTYEDWSCY